MSTMIYFANNALSDEFLTMDDLRRNCPSAFKEEPTNPKVSDRYMMATTATVVEDLAKLGWHPVQAKQCRPKKGSSGIRSFHMIAFQNPDVKITQVKDGMEIVDAYPRIILTNSHDGFNSFKFMVGLFRLVCSNGLVVATDEMANMCIRHINYDYETLRMVVNDAVSKVPSIVFTMNQMKATELSEEQKRELATEVVKIRKGIEENEKISIDDETIDDILMPNRDEDNRSDLWTVFNICQEKMIKGGFSAKGNAESKKARKQRGITSIKKDIEFNQRLWEVASRYMPAVAEA